MNKFICLGLLLAMLFSFAACTSEDKKILKEFDLSDPKVIWTGSIEDDFADDLVMVVMRISYTYPILDLKYFKLDNAERVEYIASRPPDSYIKEGVKDYRQMAEIFLKEHGKDKVIEAIRQLEKLEFIKAACTSGGSESPEISNA